MFRRVPCVDLVMSGQWRARRTLLRLLAAGSTR